METFLFPFCRMKQNTLQELLTTCVYVDICNTVQFRDTQKVSYECFIMERHLQLFLHSTLWSSYIIDQVTKLYRSPEEVVPVMHYFTLTCGIMLPPEETICQNILTVATLHAKNSMHGQRLMDQTWCFPDFFLLVFLSTMICLQSFM